MSNKHNSSFVKVFRKMIHWEWYKTTNTKVLFLHCLLRASWEPGEWMGIHYEAGEFVTSIASLAEETGLSVQEVRTALEHLKATHELTQTITRESTQPHAAKCSVITVNKWAEYQGATRKATQKATRNSTTIKEIKEREEPASLPEGSAAVGDADDDWEWEDPALALERFREEQMDEGDL